MLMDFCTLGEMLLSSGIDINLIGCKREELLFRLNALESYIVAHTHNNFVNKRKSFHAKSENGKLLSAPSFVTGKTTVCISNSINKGMWTVKAIDRTANTIEFTEYLADAEDNKAGVVEYPPTIVNGAFNLLVWNLKHDYTKDGIKSETISRHTVTYFDTNNGDKYMNYPSTMFDFLKPYYKARF